MRNILVPCLVSIVILSVGCGGNQATSYGSYDSPYGMDTRTTKEREEAVNRATQALAEKPGQAVTAGINSFGLELLKKSYDSNNLCVSPISIAFALGMAELGSGGETRKQFAELLGNSKLSGDQFAAAVKNTREILRSADPKVQLAIANSIWTHKDLELEPAFLQQNADVFGAQASVLDFADLDAPKEINDWVSANTNKRIPTIIDKISGDIKMFLINAVYFKGFWRDPFDKKLTSKRPFHLAEDKVADADTMVRMGTYPYVKVDDTVFLALPFGNGRFQYIGILPSKKVGLKGFVSSLSDKSWSDAMAKLSPQMVDLSMPRFSVAWEGALNDTLKAMGLKDAFTDSADFSGMRKEKDLFVSQVRHKAVVIVDEEGAEAAAATSVAIGAVSIVQPVPVVFDRPFAFAIRDAQSGALLFMGTVQDPS